MRKFFGLAAALALACAAFTAASARSGEQLAYDILIRGGQVLDGAGSQPRVADVGIRGDRIVAVGDLAGAQAERVIDAAGLYVAPGFIDLHSHASGGLTSQRLSVAHALLAQGITTAVINPDGNGSRNIAGQRGSLLEHGLGVNVIQLVPHNTIRSAAMGGSHNRPPTPQELDRMRQMVREGMEAGGFGLSSGLFYTPGSYSETSEVIEVARVAAEYGGVHSSHIRDEADYDIGVVNSVQEIIDISRASGVVGVVSHIKALGPNVWGHSREIVQRIEAARAEGVEVWADQYPYEASSTSLTAALVPAWARASGDGGLSGRLRDPETAPRIRAEVEENLARRGGAERIMFTGGGALGGRTLADYAAQQNLSHLDAAMQLISGGGRGIISFNMNDDDIERLMRQPWMLTSTDGGLPAFGSGTVHPRAYGAFARKIARYVRERETVSLPFAIRSMTGASAEAFRIRDRGFVRSGHYADLVIFDYEKVNDPASYLEPHQYSEGFQYVLVNGVFTIDNSEFTNALPGRVLNRQGPDFTRGADAGS